MILNPNSRTQIPSSQHIYLTPTLKKSHSNTTQPRPAFPKPQRTFLPCQHHREAPSTLPTLKNKFKEGERIETTNKKNSAYLFYLQQHRMATAPQQSSSPVHRRQLPRPPAVTFIVVVLFISFGHHKQHHRNPFFGTPQTHLKKKR